MKSIRFSLVVYFLTLLGLALGATAGLAYWTVADTVRSRREASADRLRLDHVQRCQREHSLLDRQLLSRARTLASLAQLKFEPGRGRLEADLRSHLGLLTAGPSSFGYLQAPAWAAEGMRGPIGYRIFQVAANEVQFTEDDLPHDPDAATAFFQVTTEWGNSWRSRSLESHPLPLAPGDAPRDLFDWKYDDLTLADGTGVRCVSLKTPVSRFRFVGTPGRRSERPPETTEPHPRHPKPEKSVADSAAPTLLIQYATDTGSRERAIAESQARLDRELERLDQEAADTLASLRGRILAVGLITFAATVGGGLLLVGLGLAPLRRLSEAVSRVSEKDFRLRLDGARLPAELRPIVDRLTQTLGLLQRAFGREKQAAADISHELRTPLAALLTTTEVALRKTRGSDEYKQVIEDCRGLGLQMSQLVERLLALARLDAGVDTLRPSEVDAAALSGQCMTVVRPLAEAHGIRIDYQPTGPASLTADPVKFREVVTNLLHNAIAYNRPGGSVDLTVERQNGDLLVEVRDTGIGMSPDVRAHIFERFYRADASRQATGVHAGLGLAIVKGYLDLMGGTISVDSAEGRGSTFSVRIPAAPASASRPQEHL
jgi:signal transduction histidine kinase